MELIYATVTLLNAVDVSLATDHKINKEDIRKLDVNMLVGSTADMLCINEEIKKLLNLNIYDRRKFLAPDGKVLELGIAGTVRINFENRTTCCGAVVMPGNSQPKLGRITMEALDVIIDPATQKLIIHPDRPVPTLRNMSRINAPNKQSNWYSKKH